VQAHAEIVKREGIHLRFEAAQSLSGEQGFVLSKGDGVRLAQLLLAEPQDASTAMSDDHKDAVGELFRQFAGAAAMALKGLAGGEVSFKWAGMEPLQGEPGARIGVQVGSANSTPFIMLIEVSSALVTALNPAPQPSAPALVLPAPTESPARARDAKLELLMDVELDVTLRFGERQLLLRDILDLNAGSVVELDQNVQDPVDLLVGGKVVARGEVVVVDGNYGLRVMEIVSPMERIESLRR